MQYLFQQIHPSPTCAFGIWYDICIKVAASDDPVAEAQQKLMELLQKIQEVDQHAVIYLWLDADQQGHEPAIDNLEEIPTLLSNLKKYA